jgi:hypothetical protein
MDEQRNRGVTEARFALTLLTCLLVAIGYIMLLRLSGTKEPIVDSGPDDVSPHIASAPPNLHDNDQSPHVIPLERPEDASVPKMTKRPDHNDPPRPSTKPERR